MNRGKIISKFLRYSGMLSGIRQLSSSNNIKILMYHRVFDKSSDFPYYLNGIKKEDFDNQMKFLAKHFSVLPLEDAVECITSRRSLPKNAMFITIDDGYKDCYTHIYPILRKYRLPATVFLTTDNVNSSNAFWIDKVGYLFKKGKPLMPSYEHNLLSRVEVGSPEKRIIGMEHTIQKLKTLSEKDKDDVIDDLKNFFQVVDHELQVNYNLTWPEVKEMSENNISFGAHTVSHPILTQIPFDIAEKEIKESKERIEEEIGKPIYGFCYPNGGKDDFNNSIIDVLKKYGFKYAITTMWGFNDANTDPFKLKRIGPSASDNMDRFDYIVSGGFKLSNRIKNITGMRR